VAEEPSSGGDLGVALPDNLADLPYRDAKQRALDMFDDAYFSALLRRTGGNISEAARQAGLDRSNFRRASKRTIVKSSG
jgi:transcriptional regulator of acetoin/glycerol metabolism